MASMYDDFIDSGSDKPENDITSQRVAYHLHHQQVLSDNEGYDQDKVCVTSSDVGHISLRMPSKEEIDKIIAEMIFEVYSNYNLRNRIVNNDIGKPSRIFIKDITHKMKEKNKKSTVETIKIKDSKPKKWEPKKKVQFQAYNVAKAVVQEKQSGSNTTKQIIVPIVQKTTTSGILVKPTMTEPIDMIFMLSQITVKVPLSKLFRIEEHKSKVLLWLGGIGILVML